MINSYIFTSDWAIQAPVSRAEHAIIDIAKWHDWWLAVDDIRVLVENDSYVGSEFASTWRSRAGYGLRLRITITEYVPGSYIAFDSAGDLKGSGSWRFTSNSDNCTAMKIDWDVQPTKPWMRLLSPLLRPVFVYNHHLIMEDGERSLNRYLKNSPETSAPTPELLSR
jgi:hypothetical protein